jgi:hypothetical protein
MLYGVHYADLQAVEEDVQKRIVIRPLAHLHSEQYEVYAR